LSKPKTAPNSLFMSKPQKFFPQDFIPT